MNKHKHEVQLFLSKYASVTPTELLNLPVEAQGKHLSVMTQACEVAEWTLVGTGLLELNFFTPEVVNKNAVACLEKQLAEVKFQAHQKCTHIENQIKNLLAIGN